MSDALSHSREEAMIKEGETPETDALWVDDVEIPSVKKVTELCRSLERRLRAYLHFANYLEPKLREAEKDARRYRKLKEKLRYEKNDDGMAWMTLEWCVEVWSMSPESIDAAIDAEIDK